MFFFQHFKYFTPLFACGETSLFQKLDLISYSCSSTGKVFFSPSFQLSFMILVQSLISAIEYDVLRSAYFAIYPAWCALSLLNLWFGVCNWLWKILSHSCFKYFPPLFSLFSFSDILIMHRPYFLKFSYHSWMFCFFFLIIIIFSVCILVWQLSIDLSSNLLTFVLAVLILLMSLT